MWNDRETRISILIFAVLVLSLECVLEGMVTQADLRTWFFHALAVGVASWAFATDQTVAHQATMIAGVVAVANEGLLLSQESIDLKFLIPSTVLLVVCIIGLFSFDMSYSSSSKTSAQNQDSQIGGPQPVTPRNPLGPPSIPPIVPGAPSANRGLSTRYYSAPSLGEIASVVGAIIAWYSLSISNWFNVEKLFGLRTVSAGFSELRDVGKEIDGLNPLATSYLTFGYLVTYAVIFGVLGSSLLMRTRWSIEHLRPDLFTLFLVPLAFAWHTYLAVDLSGEVGRDFISTGPLIGGVGLVLMFAGTIVQRTRS